MGIVIGQGPLYPERTIGTPEDDTAERGMRIQDYVNKIKGEAVTASLWSGREARIAARLAGQEPPPIDHHAGTRAEVPAEMFPPVLIVGNNDPLEDWNGNAVGYIVSQRFRDAVEVFDPGIHQFVPVELRRHDGQLYEGRPYYYMRVTRLINAINLAQSPRLRQVRFFSGDLKDSNSTLLNRIQSLDVSQPFRHVQQDFRGNGLYVPASGVDALALGSSTHSGSHKAIDDFMAELYDQIGKRAAQAEADYTTLKTAQLDANPNSLPADYARIATDAKIIADNLAAREHAIASNFRALAVQEDGIPEAAARLSLGPNDTVLAYNNSDLRNTVGANWAEGKSTDASAAFTMENIAGRIDAARLLDIDLVKLRDPNAELTGRDTFRLYGV